MKITEIGSIFRKNFLEVRNVFRFCLALSALLCVKVISAQHYFFTNYSTEHGLSNPGVLCIVEDNDGFL